MSQKAHQCPQCNYTTNKGYNLKRHIKTVHADVENQVAPKTDMLAPKTDMAAPKTDMLAPKTDMAAPKTYTAAEQADATPQKCGTSTKFCCNKCKKTYTRQSKLKAHEDKCNGLSVLQCPYCYKTFTSTDGKYQHKLRCKSAPKPDADSQDPTILNQTNYNQCTINNNTVNNNTNNIQININHFNYENTDYITEEFARKCFESGVHGVNPMIDKLYFDEEHPENHNVKLKSLNHSLVEVHTDKGWVPCGLMNVIDRMISNSTGTILYKTQFKPTNVEEDALRLNSLQNITSENKKKIRERTKSKLVERREYQTTVS